MTWRAEGISAEVIDVATLKPLDVDTILASVDEDRALRDRPRGAAAPAASAPRSPRGSPSEGLLSLLAPVERVTGYDTVMPLSRLEQHYLPSEARIVGGAPRAASLAGSQR